MLDATLTKKIKNLEQRVRLLETRPMSTHTGRTSSYTQVIWNHPTLRQAEEKRREKILQETAGVLKKPLPKNAVSWQRAIRAEWA